MEYYVQLSMFDSIGTRLFFKFQASWEVEKTNVITLDVYVL